MKGWDNISVEELYQRDINYAGIKKQIAPYLTKDESRFFGAFIVAAINFDEGGSFEPLPDVATKGLPAPYRIAATNIGFLTFTGGEVLVPLDGQHRLKAIEFAITGNDERGRSIAGVEPCDALAKEDVSVILVAYKPAKARKIFTKVNRYAKPTTTGQNIVTDDDDVIAVLTREVADELIGGQLVKFSANTIRANDSEFTTMAIIYTCNEAIISECFPGEKPDKTQLPEEAKQKLYHSKVFEVWETLLERIGIFKDAIADKKGSGDDGRCEIRKGNLLGRPVAQEVLVRAYLRLTNAGMKAEKACANLDNLPWAITEANLKTWQNVLWTGGKDGKIITKNRTIAVDIAAYLAGEELDQAKKAALLERYRELFPEGERAKLQLPELKG